MTVLDNYKSLISKIIRRKKEVIRFDLFLREQTSWLTSPASTRFHLAYEGGLLAHSVNVTSTLFQLRQKLAPDIEEESCIVVGLFHDIGKIGMPDQPYYIPNPSEWHVKNKGINYIVNQDLVHLDIATRSLFLVAQYIPLSNEEALAIRYHDGQYIKENISVAHKEARLTRLLQYADNWSGGVLEDQSDA